MYYIVIGNKKYIIKNGRLVQVQTEEEKKQEIQEMNQQIENLINKKKEQLQ